MVLGVRVRGLVGGKLRRCRKRVAAHLRGQTALAVGSHALHGRDLLPHLEDGAVLVLSQACRRGRERPAVGCGGVGDKVEAQAASELREGVA